MNSDILRYPLLTFDQIGRAFRNLLADDSETVTFSDSETDTEPISPRDTELPVDYLPDNLAQEVYNLRDQMLTFALILEMDEW